MSSDTPPVAPALGTENRPPAAPAWRENLNIHLICPDCKQDPPDLIEENADTICNNCGRVLAERLVSYESEWRTFNTDEKGGEDPNRVGEADSDLLIGNQGTTIGGGGMNMTKETRKLKKAQGMQNEDKTNRYLLSQYAQLEAWAEADHFGPTVKELAKSLYKQVHDQSAFRGKNNSAVLASCLFIACRQLKIPRSFAEIMNLTKVPKKDIGRIFKNLNKFFQESANNNIEQLEKEGGIVNHEALAYTSATSSKPGELVSRFCGMLGMEFRVQIIAGKLAEEIPNIPTLAGRSPLSNAGACIYFASHLIGRGKSSQEISQVINVSDATIKHAYRYLYKEKDRLVLPEWLGQQPSNTRDKAREPAFGRMSNLPVT